MFTARLARHARLSSCTAGTRPGRRDHRPAVAVYLGGMLTLGAVAADEWLDLRQWKHVQHSLVEPVQLTVRIRARTRAGADEAGQGCVDWPTGRALLQWAVDGGVPLLGAHVLEIGAGVGLTSIGLALAAQRASEEKGRASPATAGGPPNATSVIATDVCEVALTNLRCNAASNGASAMRAELWDAAGGREAVERMPVAPRALTHVIGADLVSQPIAGAARPAAGGTARHCGGDGLEATLAALLEANPELSVTLVLYNRFAGGAVSALASNVGAQDVGCTLDPAIVAFERRCSEHGLRTSREALPPSCARRLAATQPLHVRAQWLLGGVWDGLLLYHVSRAPALTPQPRPSCLSIDLASSV